VGAIIFAVVVGGIALAMGIQSTLHRRRRARTRIRVDLAVLERIEAAHGPIDLRRVLDEALARAGEGLDVYEQILDRVDLSRFRPKLASDIEVKLFPLRWGNDYAMVANPRAMLYYRLEPWEADLLPLMDGTRTVGDIAVARLEEDGDLDASGATQLVQILELGGFLEPVPVGLEEGVTRALDPLTPAQRKLRIFLKTLSIEWTGADRFVRWWYRWLLRPIFRPVGATIAGLIAIGGFVAFVDIQTSGRYTLGSSSAPAESLILLGLGFVLTFFHELGHAVTITHFGRRVKSAGFMIYFGSPAFFVEASDSLMLDRRQRILQSFGGPFAELVLAGVSTILLALMPDAGFSGVLYRFALINYFVIFLNLIPLLELDGYWILSDLIQVPDLRPRSLEFMQHDLWHKLRTHERMSRQELGLGLYAVIGIVFTVFSFYTAYFFWKRIFGGLVSSLWNGGVGSRLLLLLLAVFLGGPAMRGLIQLLGAIVRRVRGIVRGIVFRAESRWRVEAAELIDALPAFDDLPVEILNDLAGRVSLKRVRAGQPIFRQGDRPTAFYVVRNGRIAVEEEDHESGDVQVLRTMERGESFGEMGLLQSARRTATVRAIDDAEVFEVDKGTFDRLLADSIDAPEFAPTMQAMAELRDLPPFAGLGTTSLAELLEHGRWASLPPGTPLVTQGEPSDLFYVIHSGQATVSKDGREIRTLGPGAHFGEIGLLGSVPRSATVTTLTPMRAFALDREGFDRVVADAFTRGSLKLATGRTWHH
jgi:cAMP-binding proteins - catabolite gene activator and regulatory subunit of cAMP-dependent protein kinases